VTACLLFDMKHPELRKLCSTCIEIAPFQYSCFFVKVFTSSAFGSAFVQSLRILKYPEKWQKSLKYKRNVRRIFVFVTKLTFWLTDQDKRPSGWCLSQQAHFTIVNFCLLSFTMVKTLNYRKSISVTSTIIWLFLFVCWRSWSMNNPNKNPN